MIFKSMLFARATGLSKMMVVMVRMILRVRVDLGQQTIPTGLPTLLVFKSGSCNHMMNRVSYRVPKCAVAL